MFNIKYILHLPIFLLLFISCKQDDSDFLYNLSSLSAFNAVPSAAGYDLYLDDRRFNTYSENFEFGSYMRYRSIFPGNRRITLINPASASQPVLSKQIVFDEKKFYTLLITRQDAVDYLLVEDDIQTARKGKAYLRFAHLSADSPALSMKIDDNSIPAFSNKNYKSVSTFFEIDAGVRNGVIASSDESFVPLTFENNFVEQGIYTVFVAGTLETKERSGKLNYFIVKY